MGRESKRYYRTTWGDMGATNLKVRVERVSPKKKITAENKFFLASATFLLGFALSMLSAYGLHASDIQSPNQIVISQLVQH